MTPLAIVLTVLLVVALTDISRDVRAWRRLRAIEHRIRKLNAPALRPWTWRSLAVGDAVVIGFVLLGVFDLFTGI